MNPTAAVNLALAVLAQVLALISELKSSSGMTDDQILAEAQTICAGNDQAYLAIKAALVQAGATAS
jgi:hypothetical protein